MKLVKGIITENYLHVRVAGPNTWEEPLPQVLSKGDEILIQRAVYGEELEGENIWFVLDSGNYVWSGYVAAEEGIEELMPSEKRVIFTADDYGVVDSINWGVIHAVNKGLLNSVTCLTNFGEGGSKSLANIQMLLQKTKDSLAERQLKLELGVHLTITSGSPILKDVTSLVRKTGRDERYPQGEFNNYTELRDAYKALSRSEKKEFVKDLKRELQAQINVFLDNDIKIYHLTSHHNSLLYFPEFFEVMCQLAYENGEKDGNGNLIRPIPLRSLENKPAWKDYGFLFFKGDVKFPGSLIRKLKRIIRSDEFKLIQSPEVLHSNYFGPIPKVEKKGLSYISLVHQKEKKGQDMIHDLRKGRFVSMEFLLHLRSGEVYKDQDEYEAETLATGYAGINHLSFDARTAEFQSFVNKFSDPAKLHEPVSLGSWEEIRNGYLY